MLPLLQGVELFVQVLVEPPDLPLPQGGAEKQAHGSLRPPDGPLTAVHGELGQRSAAYRRICGRRHRSEIRMLAGDEGGDVVHRQIVDQSLIGLGIVALIVDEGESRALPDALLDPVSDRRQGGGEPRRIDGIALVDVGIEWELPIPRDEQGEAELAESETLVL